MGLGQSKKKPDAEHRLGPLLDKIATKYIITQNFTDLANLEKRDYCDKLIILTSNIFNKFLDKQDVKYLEQRLERGVPVDKMKKDTLIYLEKNDINKLDVHNSIRKKRMCIGIAQFYVKIGHIFAAILKTLNPEYVFKDHNNEFQRISILEKNKIPYQFYNPKFDKEVSISLTKNINNNLCSRRIKALTPKLNRNGKYNLRVCKINRAGVVTRGIPGTMGPSRKFNTEIGIPELRFLYLDHYNYGTGQFTNMTEKSKKEYQQDVSAFYKVFTGQSRVPSDITEFSQIPLGDFHNQSLCQEPNGLLQQKFSYDETSSVYVPYAKHLSNMMNNAISNQNKLIDILNKLFVKEINNVTHREEYTVNPSLTSNKLQKIIVETRKLILELYIQCEKDFRQGIKLFEMIIEKKEQMRNENRRQHLVGEFNELLQ